jgi:hypothetical protein
LAGKLIAATTERRYHLAGKLIAAMTERRYRPGWKADRRDNGAALPTEAFFQ